MADKPRYYEDFQIGDEAPPVTRAIDRKTIDTFISMIEVSQPLFLDPEVARAAGHRDVIAPGPVVLSFALASLGPSGWTRGTAIGLFGVDGVRFKKPVYAGDTVTFTNTVVSMRPSGKGGRGYVTFHVRGTNQNDEILIDLERTILVKARPASA